MPKAFRIAGRTHTYNSRLAQELAKWADTKPGFEKIHEALYKAYFVDLRNLADKRVLLDVAQSVGLPVDEAESVLDNRTFKHEVDTDWQKARQYGITGVPTFVVNGSLPGLSRFSRNLGRCVPWNSGLQHRETEKLFMASFNATVERYRALLAAERSRGTNPPDLNLDLGKPTTAGMYKISDETYAELVTTPAMSFLPKSTRLRGF